MGTMRRVLAEHGAQHVSYFVSICDHSGTKTVREFANELIPNLGAHVALSPEIANHLNAQL